MSGAEFILRKLLFGQRADVQRDASLLVDRGTVAPVVDALPRGHSRPSMASAALGLLPGGVSGGEDFNPNDSEI